MSVTDLSRKSLPMPTQLLLRRHHDMRTCNPDLEGMLFVTAQ
jgi:hypothetical protein